MINITNSYHDSIYFCVYFNNDVKGQKNNMAAIRFEISKQNRIGRYSMHSPHEHSYFEMYYLIDGMCDLLVADNIYSLTSGTLIFLPMNTIHQTNYPNTSNHTRLYIEFTENYIVDLVNEFGKTWLDDNLFNKLMFIPESVRPSIHTILDNIIDSSKKRDHFSQYIKKIYFQELVIQILRFHRDFFGASQGKIKIADEAIQRATDFITNHYTQNISLDDVSGMLHLNSSYFSKKFKTVTGTGFKEYLSNIRINHSEKLLLETDISITDIAFKCGYNNSNYYGDAFKKKNGVSPTYFRRKKGNIR